MKGDSLSRIHFWRERTLPCHICTSLTDEQLQKIQNRKQYLKKQKAETSSKDELDLLGEGDGDSFTGSNADLESAADNLFTSPPRPQPLAFSSLSLKTPAKAVPPTPGTVLQNKIQRNLEKSLGDSLCPCSTKGLSPDPVGDP